MTEAGMSRRAQRREQTMQEIRDLAMEQIAASGPEAVSLNGIARAMSMSPAAVYRYFDSRDALLADLVVGVYDSLADALEAAGGGRVETPAQRLTAVTRTPAQRFTAVAHAFRSWALEQPNAYRLIFQTSSGSGQDLAPDRTIPAASRSMGALLAALSPLASSTSAGTAADVTAALGIAAGRTGAGGAVAGGAAAGGAAAGGAAAGGAAAGGTGPAADGAGAGGIAADGIGVGGIGAATGGTAPVRTRDSGAAAGGSAAGGTAAGGTAPGRIGAGGVAAGAGGIGAGSDGGGDAGKGLNNPELGAEMRVWAVRANLPPLPVRVLALGFISWTRLHGVISLELGHHLASTGIDPTLLYEAEIETLIQQASAS
jgi:AcrR family transcriptional regulator